MSRLEDVRRLLRDRHAGIEPDAYFVDRVMARLPRHAGWSIAWAARRILPVSIAVAMVLTVALVAIGRSTNRTTTSTSVSASTQSGSDPLDWLLEAREERR